MERKVQREIALRAWRILQWLQRSMVETAQTRTVGVALIGFLVLTNWGGTIPQQQLGNGFQYSLKVTAWIMMLLGLFAGLFMCKKRGKLALRLWWAGARPYLIVAAAVLLVFLSNLVFERYAPVVFARINRVYLWFNRRPLTVLFLFLLIYACVLVLRSLTMQGGVIRLRGTQVGQHNQVLPRE